MILAVVPREGGSVWVPAPRRLRCASSFGMRKPMKRSCDLQGKFTGTWTLAGGTTEKATHEAAGKLVGELIKEVRRNR